MVNEDPAVTSSLPFFGIQLNFPSFRLTSRTFYVKRVIFILTIDRKFKKKNPTCRVSRYASVGTCEAERQAVILEMKDEASNRGRIWLNNLTLCLGVFFCSDGEAPSVPWDFKEALCFICYFMRKELLYFKKKLDV